MKWIVRILFNVYLETELHASTALIKQVGNNESRSDGIYSNQGRSHGNYGIFTRSR